MPTHVSPSRTSSRIAGTVVWPRFLLGALCGIAGLVLAGHHPLAPAVAAGLFVLTGALAFRHPASWLVVVPTLLPVIAFAPWSGWITFEETDLLVLAFAAGGQLRLAVSPDWRPRRGSGASALAALMLALFALSTLVALMRGMADAGGAHFGWFQGYHEPMNSVRLAKSFFLALLLWPLWTAANAAAPNKAGTWLSAGLVAGLVGAALATVWERLAFTDLLNFSTDYRTTAMFWEMHVGGAALDGFLALSTPFVVRELMVARRPLHWGLAAAAALLAAYACLTTFSRGVYLAVPVALVLLVVLQRAQQRRVGAHTGALPAGSLWPGVALVAAFAVAAAWMFPTSGYRGLLALFGALVVLLPLASWLRRLRAVDAVLGLAAGAVLAALAWLCSGWLPKGPYLNYTGAALCSLAMLVWLRLRRADGAATRLAPLALAAYVWLLSALAQVPWHWGGHPAFEHALPTVAGLVIVAVACTAWRRPLWPAGLRWQGATLGAMAIAAGIVSVFAGGVYMSDRFSTGRQDLDVRLQHWSEGLAMLDSPADWLLGKGMGRYPGNRYLTSVGRDHPGDYRLAQQDGNRYLVLAAGKHILGWGEVLRVSQRVQAPVGPTKVQVTVRAEQALSLHFEVCEKHLLYNAGCLIKQLAVPSRPGVWQTLDVRLEGGVSRGAWYAPKLLVFSVAMSTAGARADVDDLALTGADGHNLLANGDFSRDMAHWFFSSDRHHMPWHMKNMFLHVLFDQGAAGLALFLALGLGALWRVTAGHGRDHPLAPAIAAALVGFAVVGLFDSLLDAPRVALVFYLLLLIGLTVRAPRGA